MEKMPIAAQVYSVREEAGADFAGTMKQLKALGYDGVMRSKDGLRRRV